MEATLNTVTAWSYAFACVAFAAAAVYIGVRAKGGARGWVLVIALALSTTWAFSGWALAVTQRPWLAIVERLADIARIAAWYWFIFALIVGGRGLNTVAQLRGLMVTAAALIVGGVFAQALVTLQSTVFGSPGRLVLLDGLGMAVFGLVLLETLFRSLGKGSRWNLKPFCLGLVGAFGFDIYLYAEALLFNRIDVDAVSVRGLVHALVIPLVGVTSVRNPQWKLNVTLSRHVLFHSTALVASGIYLLFTAAAGYYVRFFGGEWGPAFQVMLIFAGLLILGSLAVSGSVRAKLKVLVSKHFFNYRYDYRDEWLRFTRTLSACDGQAALGQQVVEGLANMVESPAGALWVREGPGGNFVQTARWNMRGTDAVEPGDGAVAAFLATSGWVINLEEYRSSPVRYGTLRVPSWLSDVPNAWLIVPLSSGDELIGFTVLASPRTYLDVNWEVNDLLKTAGRQAASFLARMEASEALLESRKFDAFNRMSAFVVHDLKNVVSQLSLMLRNADRHKDNPEFQQDMLMTVANSIDRMRQLMLQLREGNTPIDPPRGVDLADMLRRIQRAKTGQQPVPELELVEGVIAKAHQDRLERVIGHIVQNAIDATERTGRVWIKLERQGDQALVEVGDTGHGMSMEFVRDRLFKPFHSTKQTGMGIGAYESQHYVQELGGRVLVESAVNVGTRFRLLLPLYGMSGAIVREPGEAAA